MNASDVQRQVEALEAAIAAQERSRQTLGDVAADAAIAALRREVAALKSQESGRPSAAVSVGGRREPHPRRQLASEALASLQSHLPEELAAKARAAEWVEGEKRQVTVLLADLSGFTTVSENTDPEVIRAFQRDLFQELARIIYQYEGFVEKFVGDAVLAVFGAPVAHEDDPERSLRVALAMRERMAVLNRRWSERLGTPVTLHIGINTGLVVAGKIGSELDAADAAYAVTGDTVNTASRLQDAAGPGQILVSRTTYRFAQEAFSFVALEPILVRNKSEPLTVYELLRARPLPGKVRGLHQVGETFVGREELLAQLRAVTEGLASGGRIVLLTGEAGVGKSRLVAEWRRQMAGRVLWLEGRCFAHTRTLSYGPILDMLRRFAGIVDDDSERQARQRLDVAVERLFPGDAEARTILASLLGMRLRRDEMALLARLSARDLRNRIFGLGDQLIGNLVRNRPLVFFLEDMHWVDLSTVELIEHLFVTTAGQPAAIVLATRPDQDSMLTRLQARMDEPPYRERAVHLSLERLSEDASLTMVRDLLTVPDLPPKLAELISTKADGNPFFIEEIIRALIERGALQRDGSGWVTTPLMEMITVPDTLQGLIMARIDRLPDETKDVIQQAAVIGRTFLYRLLLAIAWSSTSLDADLTHLERSKLILERARSPEVEYTFQHALTQEVAYQSLLTDRARKLHRQVGEAMERIFSGRLGEFYPVIAEHFRRGEAWMKTAEYYLRAGEQASQLFLIEARDHYERAIEALGRLQQTTQTRRRLIDATIALSREILLGNLENKPDDLDAAVERLRTAESLAESLPGTRRTEADDRLRLARVYAWSAQAHSMRADPNQAFEYVEKLERSGAKLDPDLNARIGQVLVHQGRFGRAKTFLDQAVDPLEANGHWVEWIHANGVLAMAEAAMGRGRAAHDRAQRGVARARRLRGDIPLTVADNYLGLAELLSWADIAMTEKEFHEELGRRRQQTGQWGHPVALRNVVTMHCAWHARNRATSEATAAFQVIDGEVETHGDARHSSKQGLYEGWHAAFHAELAFRHYGLTHAATVQDADRQRAVAEVERMATDAIETAKQRGDVFGEGIAWRVRAKTVAAASAKDARVDEYLRTSRDKLELGDCRLEVAETLAVWGELGLKRGSADARDRLLQAERTFEAAGLPSQAERIREMLASR